MTEAIVREDEKNMYAMESPTRDGYVARMLRQFGERVFDSQGRSPQDNTRLK